MLLGIIFLNKRYSLREYLSIVLITIGIIICTIVSSSSSSTSKSIDNNDINDYLWWLIGISMLSVSLLLSSSMGIIQEKLYKKYGKYPDEALFYNHLLTLPLFIFLLNDVTNYLSIFNNSGMYN